MIIGNNKDLVIKNIQKAVDEGKYNSKVEVDDPNLTEEQKDAIIQKYLKSRKKIKYKFNNKIARGIVNSATSIENKDTEIVGLENIKDIKTGAIITCNHFNPLDNTIIRKFVKKAGKKKFYIVVQETNLAMPGFIGFMMNYTDTIPISSTNLSYMKKEFPGIIKEKLEKKNFILIYPEQEMWFNYKKPRTFKPGAYFYAAKNHVPVISCFVEMINTKEKETEEFYKVKYVLHVLPPIYPDKNKRTKQNTVEMMQKDYEQKKAAYERAYGKKLEYNFEKEDIAGLI